jgi:NitT/TauT family transport system permease protein
MAETRGKGRWRGAILPIALLVAAQIAAVATHLNSDTLASPAQLTRAWIEALSDGSLLNATGETLWSACWGLVIGAGLGLLLGILLGLFKTLNSLLELSLELIRPIPVVSLIPLAMLIFGFGYKMEIAIIAFAAIWPTLILGRTAVAAIEPRLLEVSVALGLSFGARLWKIILPAMLPRIFVAFRLAAGYALIVAVTVEITANPLGLGYGIMMAQQSLHPDLMFAYLFWIGVIGWSLNAVLNWTERRLFGPVLAGGLR